MGQKMLAWVTEAEGKRVAHFKTVDEHGVTLGEHIEFTSLYGSPGYQVLSGKPNTSRNEAIENFIGVPTLERCCRGESCIE